VKGLFTVIACILLTGCQRIGVMASKEIGLTILPPNTKVLIDGQPAYISGFHDCPLVKGQSKPDQGCVVYDNSTAQVDVYVSTIGAIEKWTPVQDSKGTTISLKRPSGSLVLVSMPLTRPQPSVR
jgi:hypothetical protein